MKFSLYNEVNGRMYVYLYSILVVQAPYKVIGKDVGFRIKDLEQERASALITLGDVVSHCISYPHAYDYSTSHAVLATCESWPINAASNLIIATSKTKFSN